MAGDTGGGEAEEYHNLGVLLYPKNKSHNMTLGTGLQKGLLQLKRPDIQLPWLPTHFPLPQNKDISVGHQARATDTRGAPVSFPLRCAGAALGLLSADTLG